jgi:hypothetical protein|tara:strand:+ start:1562 stop:1759 length:198 start_codon:yes stop_codon:yes gene_type:complete
MQTPKQIEKKEYHKMHFITNAIENGWTVKKRNDSYIFIKKNENKKEILKEDYLETFVNSNLHSLS